MVLCVPYFALLQHRLLALAGTSPDSGNDEESPSSLAVAPPSSDGKEK